MNANYKILFFKKDIKYYNLPKKFNRLPKHI